jgi:hypothetical protein
MIDIQTILNYLALISIPVGVAYHIMTLNNTRRNQELQLETRQAQVFLQMYNRYNEEIKDLSIPEVLQDKVGISVEEFVDLFNNDETFHRTIRAISSMSEGLGVLVKEDLLSIRYVALMWAGTTRMYWDVMEPILPGLAEHWNYPRLWSETAYLCRELIKYMEENPELKT